MMSCITAREARDAIWNAHSAAKAAGVKATYTINGQVYKTAYGAADKVYKLNRICRWDGWLAIRYIGADGAAYKTVGKAKATF